jgi:hypothetical protein
MKIKITTCPRECMVPCTWWSACRRRVVSVSYLCFYSSFTPHALLLVLSGAMCFGGLLRCLFRRKKQSSASTQNVIENCSLHVDAPSSRLPVEVLTEARPLTNPFSGVQSVHPSREMSGAEMSQVRPRFTVEAEQLVDACVPRAQNDSDPDHSQAETTMHVSNMLSTSTTDGRNVLRTCNCRSGTQSISLHRSHRSW